MSTAPPKPEPGQEQPPPTPTPHKPNLDTLQSMLNLVLIQSGRFIKEHQTGGGTGRHKVNLRNTVPAATERFHDALDALETEVRLAHTVLRRDLALLRQDRKKREIAIAAKQKEAEKRKSPQPEAHGVGKVSTPAEHEIRPAPTQNSPTDTKHFPPALETSQAGTALDGTPTTAHPPDNDFDFDAMFGDDAMDTGNEHDNNATDMMDTSGDMGFDFGDNGPSLLRGLEDLAKSGEEADVVMGDAPELQKTVAETTSIAAPVGNDVPAANNNTTVTAAAPDDVMADMSTTDNLEDLFNLDEYENPENSSFDDAFFNFE